MVLVDIIGVRKKVRSGKSQKMRSIYLSTPKRISMEMIKNSVWVLLNGVESIVI